MLNAWLNPVVPLFICIAVFIVGLAMFRPFVRRDRGEGRADPASPGVGGLLLMLTGGSVGLAILASPSPEKRQEMFDHVFRTPPEQIDRFVIDAPEPNAHRPLATSRVVVDDATRIRRIADMLRTAREFLPIRPRSKWTAHVVMVTRDGTYYFQVESTGRSNGTLVRLSSSADGGGRYLGTARVDGLETILEEAVHSATGH